MVSAEHHVVLAVVDGVVLASLALLHSVRQEMGMGARSGAYTVLIWEMSL